MAGRFVRSSKYRHVFGTPFKADQQFTGIRGVNDGSTDGQICAVNPKFVAVATKPQGGGAFLIFTHDEVGRVSPDHPQVRGHKGTVLDLVFNPFNDNVIASGDEDGIINIWNIPEEGLTEDLREPIMSLESHRKKISKILWHPAAENILLSASWDNTLIIWNLETGAPEKNVEVPETPFGIDWDYNGGRFIVSCKKGKIMIFDAGTMNLIKEWQGHESTKAQMVAFTAHGILTTGFSRRSEREYALWDEKTGKELCMENLDTSNGVNQITYDRDTGMFYLAAKGDSFIKYFEITEEEPYIHFLSLYQSKPQTGMAAMPKRGCNVNACEVVRFYRVEKADKGNTSSFSLVPTSMTVPRKSDLFQEDIFPDSPSDEPALTASEWLEGKTRNPILMSLKAGYVPKQKKAQIGGMVNKMASANRAQASSENKLRSGSGAGVATVDNKALDALKAEVQALKSTVHKQEGDLKTLHEENAALKSNVENQEEKIESLEQKVIQLEEKLE